MINSNNHDVTNVGARNIDDAINDDKNDCIAKDQGGDDDDMEKGVAFAEPYMTR